MVLRNKAPEGLIPWIREQKDIDWPQFLIYKAGWVTEPITGQRQPCVDAACTACGKRMKLDRAYGAKCLQGNATFGVGWPTSEGNGYLMYGSGTDGFCPECGAKVKVLHSSCANNLVRYVWPMSFEKAGHDLICYLWRVERWVEKDGSVGLYASPWEAYVFDEKASAVYKRWESGYFGTYYISDTWKKLQKFEDRAYDIDIVYCPEGITEATKGTWAENSKLEMYMAVKGEYLFPIVWLKLYQRRNKAETLMTCGAAKLVAGIIAEEKKAHSYYQTWTRKVDILKGLDWKKKRPAEMLRVNKEELPYFIERAKEDGTARLMVIQQARNKGILIRPGDEDGKMSLSDQLALLENGIKPAKVRRYLDRQKRRYERDWDFAYIRDYWRMARQLGMDLNDEDVRWPQNLTGAHDRLSAQQKEMKEKQRREDFEKRYQQLSRFSWEHDGILIRPAHSAKELQKEGKALHHCVGSYAGSMVTGETAIFFIRRAAEPEKSWYTLEFDEQRLDTKQNRGLCNCDRTQEIKDFEAAWLAWVRAGCKKEKENKAA